MSASAFENTLVQLYTNPKIRADFLENPKQAIMTNEWAQDLTEEEQRDLIEIDRAGLVMASNSLLFKRQKRSTCLHAQHKRPSFDLRQLRHLFRRILNWMLHLS